MEELVTNLHMHTTYSDGTGTHADLAAAAIKAGVDVLLTTDHNALVRGLTRYHQQDSQKVLLITGEEVHDRTLGSQKNHLLVFGVDRELSSFASDPQNLIRQVQNYNGICFIAHPFEDAMPAFNETNITWERWDVEGYTGIEVWNGLSELKTRAKNLAMAGLYAYVPELMPKGANPQSLKKWDSLLAQGKKVVAVGGSDAHNLKIKLGPLHRTIFPYEFHFRCVNTHIMLSEPLTGDVIQDQRTVIQALRSGHAFVGYDLPASTRGFRFTAQGKGQNVSMGDEIELHGGVTLQIHLPFANSCRLIKDGELFRQLDGNDSYTQIITQPGIYRVESDIHFLGETRGWIYSNPIYIVPPASRDPYEHE